MRTRHVPALLALLTLGLIGGACSDDGGADDDAVAAEEEAQPVADDTAATEEAASGGPEICDAIDPEAWRETVSGTRSDLDDAEWSLTVDSNTCVFQLGEEETPELGPPMITVEVAEGTGQEAFDAAVAEGESPVPVEGVADQATYVEATPTAPFGAIIAQYGDTVVTISGQGRQESLEELATAVAGQV